MKRLKELAWHVWRVGVWFVKREKTFQELEHKMYEKATIYKPGLDASLLSGSCVLVHALFLRAFFCMCVDVSLNCLLFF